MEGIWNRSSIIGFDGPNFTGKSSFIRFVKEAIDAYTSKNNIDLKVELIKPSVTDTDILSKLGLIGAGKFINGEIGGIIEIATYYANAYKKAIEDIKLREIQNNSTAKPHYSLYLFDRTPIATYVYSLANFVIGNSDTVNYLKFMLKTDPTSYQYHNLLVNAIKSMYTTFGENEIYFDKIFILQNRFEDRLRFKEMSMEGRNKTYDGIIYEDDRFLRVLGDAYEKFLDMVEEKNEEYGFPTAGIEVIDSTSKDPKDIVSSLVISIMQSFKSVFDLNREKDNEVTANETDTQAPVEETVAPEKEETVEVDEDNNVAFEEEERNSETTECSQENTSSPVEEDVVNENAGPYAEDFATRPSLYLVISKEDGTTEDILLEKPSTHIPSQSSKFPITLEVRRLTAETTNTILVSRKISSAFKEDIKRESRIVNESEEYFYYSLAPVDGEAPVGLETFIIKYEKTGKPVTKQVTIKYVEE